MTKWALLALLAVSVSSSVSADTITVRNKTHQGKFEKFENGKFIFHITFGDTLKLSPSSVKLLKLDKPAEVSLLLSGTKKAGKALFDGYEGSKFTFKQDGKTRTVYAMKVKKMVVKAPKPGAGGGASHEAPVARKFMDIAHIEHRKDLPPAQMAALKTYVAARDQYKAYLTENTRMVTAANAATGARRVAMLRKLNTRKVDEQPLLRALDGAEADMRAAFPAK